MKQKLYLLSILLYLPFFTFAQCWKSVAAGTFHTIAIAQNGTLWAWGENYTGQLGDGTNVDKYIPTQIGSENNWVSIACGERHSLAIKQDGTLWSWGLNDYGQLGDGTNINKSIPTQIGTDTNWLSIASDQKHNLALKEDSTLWACGFNNWGQLGDGTTTNKNSFVQIGTSSNWKFISAGPSNSFAIQDDGSLWAFGIWGGSSIPTQIGTSTNWQSISEGLDHILAIQQDGSLWAWGYNDYGQLGNGTTSFGEGDPIQIGSDTDWANVAAEGYHSFALKQDNTLWVWGANSIGELGDGTYVDKYAPTQNGTDNNWLSISGGSDHCLAVKQDFSLWAWGDNYAGKLGDGTTVSKNIPTGVACPLSLGVNELQNNTTLNIYPNPTCEKLYIDTSIKVISVVVMDVNGRLVLSSNNSNNTINVSALQSGIYFLNVTTEVGVLHSRFVKE